MADHDHRDHDHRDHDHRDHYAWIPVVGPLIGGALGAVAFQVLFASGPLGR